MSAAVLLAVLLVPVVSKAQSSQAAQLYNEARAREATIRKQLDETPASSPTIADVLNRMRILARTYEDLWRLFPTSGYSDNSLWQGAMLAADAFWQGGNPADRTRALRLLKALADNFPTSSLLKQVPAQVTRLEAARPTTTAAAPRVPVTGAPAVTRSAARTTGSRAAATIDSRADRPPTAPAAPLRAASPTAAVTGAPTTAASTVAAATPSSSYATLTAIRREVLPDVLRITLELDREPVFRFEQIDGPPRVFVDMQSTRASKPLQDATVPFEGDVVLRARVGRQLNGRTRVVLDLSGSGPYKRYSIYALYDPFRIVIDFERTLQTPAGRQAGNASPEPGATWPAPSPAVVTPAQTSSVAPSRPAPAIPAPSAARPSASGTTAAVAPATPPVPPSANSTGSFSLSRQLGLGVARIVIDPGHGGHDPGAKGRGLTEADLTLDVALRLEKLLAKEPGVEVILTRRTDSYIALEERTGIANREDADLFLSIHANASDSAAARGIETYFLNFAPDPAAEAIAARENADSAKTMRNLPDIVKAIALNNKIDESRDFAGMVQASMYEQLRRSNRTLRNLGVKQAPFMVLIGATMPSVLAEISFITNRQEGALLTTEKYRQQIAEALHQGVMRYQRSLKKTPAVASARE